MFVSTWNLDEVCFIAKELLELFISVLLSGTLML